MSVNVGLRNQVFFSTSSPAANPCVKHVFPVPSSPVKPIISPPCKNFPNLLPQFRVCAGEPDTTVKDLITTEDCKTKHSKLSGLALLLCLQSLFKQPAHCLRQHLNDIGSDHPDLSFLARHKIAGKAV